MYRQDREDHRASADHCCCYFYFANRVCRPIHRARDSQLMCLMYPSIGPKWTRTRRPSKMVSAKVPKVTAGKILKSNKIVCSMFIVDSTCRLVMETKWTSLKIKTTIAFHNSQYSVFHIAFCVMICQNCDNHRKSVSVDTSGPIRIKLLSSSLYSWKNPWFLLPLLLLR